MGPEAHEGLPPASLRDALAARIQRVANQPVTASDFELERVPAHLKVSFRVVDERGRAVGSDRDLAELQKRLGDRARTSVEKSVSRSAGDRRDTARLTPDLSALRPTDASAPGITPRSGADRMGLRRPCPRSSTRKVAGGVVRGYPALVDEGSSVALRVETTPEAAERATRTGIRRLLLLAVALPRVLRARAPHLSREARPGRLPLPVGEGSRRRRPRRGRGCRPRPHGRGRSRPLPRGVRTGPRRAVGRGGRRDVPDRVAGRPHPHRRSGCRPRGARAELAHAPGRAERRQRTARRPGLPGVHLADRPAPGSRTCRATCAAPRSGWTGCRTTPAATGSG